MTKIKSSLYYKKILLVKIIIAFTVILIPEISSACKDEGVFYRVIVPGIADRKKEILRAADALQATIREKALLFAVASIETEAMKVDYPYCDGKRGDACNVGIYKMNIAMIKKVVPTYNVNEIHQNITMSTHAALSAIRIMGEKDFLGMHRAGESYFSKMDNKHIKPYIDAVKKIALIYSINSKTQLNIKTTDDMRITIKICPI